MSVLSGKDFINLVFFNILNRISAYCIVYVSFYPAKKPKSKKPHVPVIFPPFLSFVFTNATSTKNALDRIFSHQKSRKKNYS